MLKFNSTKNERKIWKLWNHAILEILLLCMEIFVYIIVVVVFIYDSKVPSSQFTLFCHYRQPSPQTSPNAMPHSTSTTTVAREQVFICQERINIPRKFISLNRQRAQRIFLLWLYANNECAFSLSLAPRFWLPQTLYFRFMNPIHNVCDFSEK